MSKVKIKKLTTHDYKSLENMDTGLTDDYVLRIFDKLVKSDHHSLFGLFEDNRMVSIGGFSLFGKNKFAMIGRMRTDKRFYKKGKSTQLLQKVMEELQSHPDVKWIGANTHLSNTPARRVLENIGLEPGPVTHALTLQNPMYLGEYESGSAWKEVTSLKQKKELLRGLSSHLLQIYPYECYYPLPYDHVLFTEAYLQDTSFYINPLNDRFIQIRNDTKNHTYSHVKYFWDDHYQQAGFFETILNHWNKHPDNAGCWIDFSVQGFKNIPDLRAYDVQEPWILYNVWK